MPSILLTIKIRIINKRKGTYINKKNNIDKNNIQFTFCFVYLIQLVCHVFFLTWGYGVTIWVSSRRILFDIGYVQANLPNLILRIR
ncbi:hypothetical protein BpHYR1_049609 [Brachionus plicatilis]|uniref:Transmembrane protein n=1 Tax=Brachionus plicatilis TaxID=10195 RepID=A0A3M7P2K8_BRAPC|nr:hypothetical protein BpHYR1_049609 [Brachionus plicatilis]